MFQTAFVYTSVFFECSNKVATSKDTRLRMYFHGDLSVGIMCEYICRHVCTHMHIHARLCIYMNAQERKTFRHKKFRGILEPER